MPRKQRFKPSRKPQNQQANVSNPSVDDRKEINPEQSVSQSSPMSQDEAPRDIERE